MLRARELRTGDRHHRRCVCTQPEHPRFQATGNYRVCLSRPLTGYLLTEGRQGEHFLYAWSVIFPTHGFAHRNDARDRSRAPGHSRFRPLDDGGVVRLSGGLREDLSGATQIRNVGGPASRGTGPSNGPIALGRVSGPAIRNRPRPCPAAPGQGRRRRRRPRKISARSAGTIARRRRS